ncbi:MAG TPA: polysaccharide lyase 8 family protein [Candidatus Methylacidiphilales bacterium]|nr:polysaccharide lyase 8 family protein [Candidatus Methylacidiphilales bacterium]
MTTAGKVALDARRAGKTSTIDQSVEGYMKSLTPEGKWPDINYGDKTRGAWSPADHVRRLTTLARTYASPDQPLHKNKELLNVILSGLNYWLENDHKSPNWWHNDIFIPQQMGYLLILMDTDIPADTFKKALAMASRSSIKMTGQNRVWLSGNVLIQGVLSNDAALVQKARDAINDTIVVSLDEGVQPDNSFHQHGPQLELGNYGLAFASDGIEWVESLKGTRMALGPDKVEILRNYLIQGVNLVVWNKMMDISSCGRQLFVNSQASKGRSAERLLNAMEKSDLSGGEAVTAAYRKALVAYNTDAAGDGRTARNEVIGTKMFWNSDYMVDRRANYLASVKMSSKRISGGEVVNQENLSGYYLGDGALYVYKTGKEYENIFPAWDWNRLPGVTSLSRSRLLPEKKRNTSEFVGGVTDGQCGAAVLDYHREGMVQRNPEGVQARKSWFFFEGQIVCLGSGISTLLDGALLTSVNQCLLSGPVSVGVTAGTEKAEGAPKEYAGAQWVWHDGTGYVFPQATTVTVGAGEQKGSWRTVYESGPAEEQKRNVFSLWIGHGEKPKGASYAYVVLPGATDAQTKDYANSGSSRTTILHNTGDLQAVKCGTTAIAVFYKAGAFRVSLGDGATEQEISVDQPCLLIASQTPQGLKVTVSDPTQKLSKITVTTDTAGKKQTWNTVLPTGPMAGSSIAVTTPTGK